MRVFFNTFLRFFAILTAILLFFLIVFSVNSYFNDTNLSQFKFIEGDRQSENKIVILKLNGPIINDYASLNQISLFEIITPDQIKKNLKELKAINPKIIIVSINSPGGTVSASYEVYKIIKKFREENNIKLYFHTEESLTSGAYWLSLSGDKIYASYGSIIGSIGVKGPDWIYYDEPVSMSSGIFGNSIETKKGIKVFSQNAGKSKDLLNPFREPTKNEIQELQLIINDIYEDFVYTVSKKRKIEINTIKNDIGAIIYNSKRAKLNYLIDDVISLNSLILNIVKVNDFDNYKLFKNIEKKFSIFDKYFLKFLYFNSNNKIQINRQICMNFKINISSVSSNYLLNC